MLEGREGEAYIPSVWGQRNVRKKMTLGFKPEFQELSRLSSLATRSTHRDRRSSPVLGRANSPVSPDDTVSLRMLSPRTELIDRMLTPWGLPVAE